MKKKEHLGDVDLCVFWVMFYLVIMTNFHAHIFNMTCAEWVSTFF